MSETTDAVAGHAPNLFARWIVDDFPRFQVSCECGWKTAAEDSEQAATASHAEHARQPIGSPTWNPMRQAYDRPPTLAEFLLARIDEDETDARRAMEGFTTSYWTHDGGIYAGHPTSEVVDWVYNRAWEHVARWDPARVLAECAAKRAVVAEHSGIYACPVCVGEESFSEDSDGNREFYRSAKPAPCATLRLLALPYADHPDYREEWKP